MSYLSFTPYLSPEYPKYTENESQIGNEYKYIFPDSLVKTSKPQSGEVWEDGRAVTDIKITPSLDNSGWSEMTLSTIYASSQTAMVISSTPDEIRYSIRPSVSQVELCQHPDFLPGGSSDLYTDDVTSGTVTGKPVAFVMAWENEPDPITKGKRKFYSRDGEGEILDATPIAVPAGAALAYVKLRMLGYSTKDVYNPVFSKISTYRGDEPPLSSGWGHYMSSGDSFLLRVPSDLKTKYPQWIKTGDEVERIGTKARWQRTEQATGYTKVYFDVSQLNPAANSIP